MSSNEKRFWKIAHKHVGKPRTNFILEMTRHQHLVKVHHTDAGFFSHVMGKAWDAWHNKEPFGARKPFRKGR